MKSKPLGKITTKLPKKVVPQMETFDVKLKVTPDSPEFMPTANEEGGFDLFVNATIDVNGVARHTITSRVIQKIDCGFSISVPPGYRLIVEPLTDYICKGLIIQAVVQNQRVIIYAHNLGKEILVLNKGDKVARMFLTSDYKMKLQGNLK